MTQLAQVESFGGKHGWGRDVAYYSILVPLDGSPSAEQSLPLALSIANRAGACLDIVRVEGLYALQDPHSCWLPYNAAEDAAFRKKEEAYVEAIVKRLRTMASGPVTSALLGGLVEEAILGRIRAKHVDLVVMMTHARSPMSRFLLGSVAVELVRLGQVPVLLVRPRESMQDLGAVTILRRILIPLDGSELAEQVLEPAIALGCLMGAEFILIRAIEPGEGCNGLVLSTQPSVIGTPDEERKREAHAYLDRVADEMQAKGLHVETQVAVGAAAAAVLDAVRDQKIDLIALATHGRGGLKRLLMGSVAGEILRGTFTPVLAYRPVAGGSGSQ